MRKFSWKKVNVAVPVPVPGRIDVRVRRSQAWKISLALAVAAASALIILMTGYSAKLPSSLIWHRTFIGFFCSLFVAVALELLLDRVGIPMFVKKNEELRTVWVGEYEDDYIKLPIPQAEDEPPEGESAAADADEGKGGNIDFSVGAEPDLSAAAPVDMAAGDTVIVDNAAGNGEGDIIADDAAEDVVENVAENVADSGDEQAGENVTAAPRNVLEGINDDLVADILNDAGGEEDDTDAAVDKLLAEATAGAESDAKKAAEEPHFMPLVPGTEPHFNALDTDVLEKIK